MVKKNAIGKELKKCFTAKESMVFAFFDGRYQSVPTRLVKMNKNGDLVKK
jgi:hypothetical protein